MARTATKGKCKFCQKELTKGRMTNHLVECPARLEVLQKVKTAAGRKKSSGNLFHLLVGEPRGSIYWMHLQIPVEATLDDLDRFLRNEWLECCGHLSAFTIGEDSYRGFFDTRFVDAADYDGEQSMDGVKLADVLSVGQEFEYEYDFGSTTELTLKVIARLDGPSPEDAKVEILAKNDPPEFECSECGEPATQICMECIEEDAGFLCENCVEEHDCDEEMLLPVVNSPRMGVCAYGT